MNKQEFQTFHASTATRAIAHVERDSVVLPIDCIARNFFKYRLEIAEATVGELLLYFPEDPNAVIQRAYAICAVKSNDYATEADIFANFRQCEQLGLCPTPTGVLVRLSDKFSRLHNLIDLCK